MQRQLETEGRVAARDQHRPTRAHVEGRELGVVRVTLGAPLAQEVQQQGAGDAGQRRQLDGQYDEGLVVHALLKQYKHSLKDNLIDFDNQILFLNQFPTCLTEKNTV